MVIRDSFTSTMNYHCSPKIRQAVAASSAGMMLMAMVITWVFAAVALPQMEEPGSTVNLAKEEASWFASLPLFLGIPGSAVVGMLCERFGPRKLLLVLSPPLCASTAMMAAASLEAIQAAGAAEILLLVSRVLQGGIGSLFLMLVIVYTYEVCDRHLRGTFIAITDVWASLAYIFCYLSGAYLRWYTQAWLLPVCTLVPGFCGALLSPESPMWLARKGRDEAAIKSLTLVRNSVEEMTEELQVVRNSNTQEDNTTLYKSLQLCGKKFNLIPIILSSTILILKELCGGMTLGMYIVFIFQQAGVGLSPIWSSVVIGLLRLICNVFASTLLHNAPRKPTLLAGNILITLSLVALGTFFFLQSQGQDLSRLEWLPLCGLGIYIVGYAGALGPTTWIVALEILPGAVRSLGLSLSNVCFLFSAFIISKVFDATKDQIGMHGVFWSYSVASLLYMILILVCIPETRGLSLEKVESYWKKI
ncbi:facilitated trehalose transporter Tret1-like [Panulirus ornatus]|uniref:facilitated trehalose transporter Tret1-like n=1 Tax=Panulirus ornatus TaxID=150431 RepID=UPI003A8B6EA3